MTLGLQCVRRGVVVGGAAVFLVGRLGGFGCHCEVLRDNDDERHFYVNNTNFILANRVSYWWDLKKSKVPVQELVQWYWRPVTVRHETQHGVGKTWC